MSRAHKACRKKATRLLSKHEAFSEKEILELELDPILQEELLGQAQNSVRQLVRRVTESRPVVLNTGGFF